MQQGFATNGVNLELCGLDALVRHIARSVTVRGIELLVRQTQTPGRRLHGLFQSLVDCQVSHPFLLALQCGRLEAVYRFVIAATGSGQERLFRFLADSAAL